MNNKFIRFTLSALTAFMLTAFGPVAYSQPADYASNRLLVEPKEGLSAANFDKLLQKHGGRKHKLGQSNLHVVDVANGQAVAVLQQLSKDPSIKHVELDRKVKASYIPNDPYYGSMWHLPVINAPAAWDQSKGDGVTIAILDSGIDMTHPDLAASLVPGWNFYDNNSDTSDTCGHGTAVAGSAAAELNNGQGVAGIAGNSKIMPMRVAYYDTTLNECYAYYSTIANGLTWAADHGAKIANISYGGASGSTTIISAANYFRSKGGLVFVSAGNDGTQSTIPYDPSTIVVSATDQSDNLASWSTYGSFVSLSAPGDYIWTTNNGAGYGQWRGTSFASPIVAGIGALVMSANPSLTPDQVQNILFTTAVDKGTAGKDIYYGYGRVDAGAAVAAAVATLPQADTQPPVASIANPTDGSTVSGLVPVTVNATDNVGVSSVTLKVNGVTIATDISSPFTFSWDSTSVANGMVTMVATASDAAGNTVTTNSVSLNVANYVALVPKADTTPPVVGFTNPVGGNVSGNVSVKVNATDDSGAANLTQWLYIDNKLVTTVTGGTLTYQWNTRKVTMGTHTLQAIAKDKAGNTGSATVQVTH